MRSSTKNSRSNFEIWQNLTLAKLDRFATSAALRCLSSGRPGRVRGVHVAGQRDGHEDLEVRGLAAFPAGADRGGVALEGSDDRCDEDIVH